MKRNFLLGLFLLVAVSGGTVLIDSVSAQDAEEYVAPAIPEAVLLTDSFNYTGALNANGWTAHSGAGTNPPSTTTPGLTYAGYSGGGTGNAALINNLGGEDVNKGLSAEQNANGATVYYSFLARVTDAADKTGDYFIHIGDRTDSASFTLFAARVYARTVGANVNFGLSNTATPTFGTTNFAKNTTYLLVLKYTINNTGNDNTSLWVFASGVPATEAAAGTPEVNNTTTTGQDIIDAVALRQGSNVNQPSAVVDEIRVGTAWADIAGAGGGTPTPTPARDAPVDFDGDGRSDYAVVRLQNSVFRWHILFNNPTSGPANTELDWGGGTNDFITPGDFDGDGKDDVAIWRREAGNSAFYVFQSQTSTFRFIKFGIFDDDPSVVRDYDGDGKDDAAIYRRGTNPTDPSMFWWLGSRPGLVNVQIPVTWGLGTDQSVPGDYTGDGRADYCVIRNIGGVIHWLIRPSTGGGDAGGNDRVFRFGNTATDTAVPGDYDGDGTNDLAVTRSQSNILNWYFDPSGTTGTDYTQIQWGRTNLQDVEVQGDYDGDGITDLAVWRPTVANTSGAGSTGVFIVRPSAGGPAISQRWGITTDQPAAFDRHEPIIE